MSEEAIETETSESFDMDGAVESIGSDLFQSEPEESVETEEKVEESVEVEEKVEKAEAEEKTEEKRKPPQSWKKEMHGFFENADPVIQDYIEQREAEMRNGIETNKEDASLGMAIRDVVKPHQQVLDRQGIDATKAVNYLLNVHARLSAGTPEQKKAFLNEIARSYGIGTQGDPQVTAMMQRLNSMEQNINAQSQKAQQAELGRIEAEVTAFAEDHPYFEDLSDDIAKLISAGYGLEDAYEKALWGNPVTRQQENERLEKERREETEKQAKQEADKAKKAKSVNVRGRDTEKAPTGPVGTMEDTLRDTYRKIQNRT